MPLRCFPWIFPPRVKKHGKNFMRVEKTKHPPCGWNSFDSYGLFIDETRALANLEAFVEKLQPSGFEYFCIDGGWYSDYAFLSDSTARIDKREAVNHMDEWGRFVPSPSRFPRGMKFLAEACHARGVKFGLHIQRGIGRAAVAANTPVLGTNVRAADIADLSSFCSWLPFMAGIDMARPGAQAYYDSWIGLLAEWGVDFIKADDIVAYPEEIEAVAAAIDKVDRPILLSLSPGRDPFQPDWPVYERCANMLRITHDIWDRPKDLLTAFSRWEKWEDFGGPSCWLDLDMIPFGALQVYAREAAADADLSGFGTARQCSLTPAQKRTFMVQRALASSPLFFGGELTQTPEEDFALVTHPGLLECNRAGQTARRIYGRRHVDIRRKEAPGGHGWLGVFNTHSSPAKVALPLDALGFSGGAPQQLTDVWSGRPLSPANGCLTWNLDSMDVALVKF